MLRRPIIAVLLAAAATFGLSAAAWTQVSTSSTEDAADIDPVRTDAPTSIDERVAAQNPAVLEQQREAWAQLVDHHARTVRQREIVQDNTWEHHQNVSEALGPRAPKHTPPPMPTVPPLDR